ncbi:MAG: DUF58 domain-containing protein [Clostridia bacterium]|nr:DUF58 domain-containing protein [Clostridia bacterium]
MSKRGIGFILVFAATLIIAMGTGIRELFFIAYALAFVCVFSALSCLLAAVVITVSSKLSNNDVQRNETITLTVNMRGIIILPCICDIYITVPGLTKSKKSLKGTQNHMLCLLPGSCKKKYGFDLLCAYKGVWQVGIQKMYVHDIFGLFSFPLLQNRELIAVAHSVSVHPKAYEIDTPHLNPPSKIGLDLAQIKESDAGDSLSSSRLYQYGDPLKRINWKQTAKTRELYVRKFELEQNPQVLILLDSLSTFNPNDCANVACDIAATIAKYYLDQNCNVRLLLVRIPDKTVSSEFECVATNQSEYAKLDELLISFKFAKDLVPLDIPLLDSAQFSNANTVHVITSNPSEVLMNAVNTLYEQDYIVSCIVPAADAKSAEKTESMFASSNTRPVIIHDIAQIPEKLGECL